MEIFGSGSRVRENIDQLQMRENCAFYSVVRCVHEHANCYVSEQETDPIMLLDVIGGYPITS